jgi:thymidylate synthase
MVEELLWFSCRGDTDAKILLSKGIKIWDGNTSRILTIEDCSHYPEGILGFRLWLAPLGVPNIHKNL